MTATSTVNGSRVRRGSPATGCRRGWRPGPDPPRPPSTRSWRWLKAVRSTRRASSSSPDERVVAGEVVEQHARIARRQMAAMQDRLELARQHVVALLAAGQGGDVAQVRDGVVDPVGADAGSGAVALAQDLVRAAADDADQGVDAGVGLALRIGPCELGVSGVERRVRIVNGILRTRIGFVEGPAVQRGVQAPRFDGRARRPGAAARPWPTTRRPRPGPSRAPLVEHGEEVALGGAGGLKHGNQVGLQRSDGGCLRHAPKRSRAEGRQQGAVRDLLVAPQHQGVGCAAFVHTRSLRERLAMGGYGPRAEPA